jgi:uncharacterized protein (DUF1015 family)
MKAGLSIKGFRGFRYNDELLKEKMEELISPPYDVISNSEQERLYQRNPYNFVRLILGKEHTEDTETDNKYTRAKKFIESWLKEGILVQENSPSVYWYEQSFKTNGKLLTRATILAAVKVYDFEEKIILPHERTKSKPKEDRYKLYTITKKNLCPIFGIINTNIEHPYELKFLGRALDDEEVMHKLYLVEEKEYLDYLSSLKDKKIFIADGHHRYETAKRIRDEFAKGENHPAAYTLMGITSIYDEGLFIGATHRVVKKKIDIETLIQKLKEAFVVDEIPQREPVESKEIIMFYQGKFFSLMPKQEKYRFKEEYSEKWNNINVNLLFYLILKPIFGIDEKELSEGNSVWYSPSIEETINYAKDRQYPAFILTPISINDFIAFSEALEFLPQKTTYFYPKLASGLVFRDIEKW